MINLSTVITADIVNSEPSWGKELGKRLEQTIYATQPAAKVFFYRGDSFQSYLPDPVSTYRLALKLRTQAKLFEKDRPEVRTDVRMSIGIGTVNLPITILATAEGEAFVISGRSFDDMVKNDKRLHIQCSDAKTNITLQSISLFTDYLFQSLTMKQAEVLEHLLNHRTQVETAKWLKKSQSTINRHVQSMGWKQIEALIELYEQSIQFISSNHG
ncbi:MAG: hypothetical protein Q8S18_07975 [Bacteroidales bacterium]|nr:hypothetical protein [Bacteroidales bacterium]